MCRKLTSALMAVAWLGGVFCAYHLGVELVGYRSSCPCLGGLLGWFPALKEWGRMIVWGSIAYMLAGSYGLLVYRAAKARCEAAECR